MVSSHDSAAEVGRLIRKAREEAGLRLEDLAARCRERGTPMSAPTLSRIERGTARVRWEQLEAIGTAMGVDPKLLLPKAGAEAA